MSVMTTVLRYDSGELLTWKTDTLPRSAREEYTAHLTRLSDNSSLPFAADPKRLCVITFEATGERRWVTFEDEETSGRGES